MKNPVQFLIRLGLLWLAVMASWPVSAVEMKGLYQASMQVEDRSDAVRKQAVVDGFNQVLIRVSGDSSLVKQDAWVAAGASAERYVLQYGYDTRTVPDAGSKTQKQVFLNVQYDANGINGLLRRNGLPIWAGNRPAMVIWMAWEQGLDRELVNATSMTGPYQQLVAEASRRGVPAVFPSFDPDDQTHVSIGDIWGMFPEPVLAASERYQAPVVLMAKVREASGSIRINALLQMEGEQHWLDVTQIDSTGALTLLMDQVIDKVGAHYALVASGELTQQIVLQVEGINSLNDYAGLARYLDSLLPISLYRMQSQQAAQTSYLLTLASSVEALEQSFRLDKKLVPVPVAAPAVVLRADPEPVNVAPGDAEPTDDEAQPKSAPEPVAPIVVRYRWRG